MKAFEKTYNETFSEDVEANMNGNWAGNIQVTGYASLTTIRRQANQAGYKTKHFTDYNKNNHEFAEPADFLYIQKK